MSTKPGPSLRRALRSFWILLALAVLAAGSLSAALAAEPSPSTGLRVAGSGLTLVVTATLAGRIVATVDRARRRSGAHLPTGGAPVRRATRKRWSP